MFCKSFSNDSFLQCLDHLALPDRAESAYGVLAAGACAEQVNTDNLSQFVDPGYGSIQGRGALDNHFEVIINTHVSMKK